MVRNLTSRRRAGKSIISRSVTASMALFTMSLFTMHILPAQSLSVFNVDASAFPKVKAQFYAFDAAGNRIAVNAPGDVLVMEDGLARTVTRVSCPPTAPPRPISSVLTIDASGSMSGDGILVAKAAAKAWINALQLGASECAITTFNQRAYLNKDFIGSPARRQELLDAVAALRADGGTDYDNALLHPPAGSLEVSKRALPIRKIIVFLSDGQPNTVPVQDAIVAEALRQGVAVYAVIFGMRAPRELKEICSRSGGQCFENVKTEADAVAVYLRILHTAQGGSPCELEWTSDGCGHSPALVVSLPSIGASETRTYTVPTGALPQIVCTPSRSLHFGNVAFPSRPTLTLQLTAQGNSARVDSVKSSDARFRITDYGGTAPPFTIGAGQSRTLTVEFAPPDSAYAFCVFTLVGDACAGNTLYAEGGYLGKIASHAKITVMRPNGGEMFVAGSDELLTWEGVMPEEKVKLEYRTSVLTPWRSITDTATGLRYLWRVPATPSDSCLLRASAQTRPSFAGGMAVIPAGTFRMGDITGNGVYSDERPVHDVTITRSFLMSRTEVTQQQWTMVMGSTPSAFRGDSLPVEQVSWYDAVAFCNSVSKQEGLDTCYTGSGTAIACDFAANGYRLPTEAEWEYACRAGTETDYHTGNMTRSVTDLDSLLDRAGWFEMNSGGKTHNVGLKEPNAFGLFDMHGNVAEWCWDWYSGTYYTANPVTDPRGPATGSCRVVRGGSWGHPMYQCSSAYRDGGLGFPSNRYRTWGFRIVRMY
ncbi:MAG: SUMF1/EgtB/PvdO family nonheme iron enzyme [Ignavibacteria bacterium]|nr:SUMF1/EgtB/PvdO family nonheme iron enzyme [Ignavibacteria bacterium]